MFITIYKKVVNTHVCHYCINNFGGSWIYVIFMSLQEYCLSYKYKPSTIYQTQFVTILLTLN